MFINQLQLTGRSFTICIILVNLWIYTIFMQSNLNTKNLVISSNKNGTKNISHPGVDIVVAVHDALNELKDMLASVQAFTPQPYHIHLVNDRSNKDTLIWMQKIKHNNENVTVHHLVKPEIGYTNAINLGITKGLFPYVIILNTDVIITPNWLTNMMTCLQQVPGCGIVGPLSNAASYQSVPDIKTKDQKNWSKNELYGNWTPEGVSRAVSHLSERVYPIVPFVNGFCMLIKRLVFDTVGLFDAQNFPLGYGEENDFVLRSRAAGFLAVVDDATYVFHHKTRSFLEDERRIQSKQGRQKLFYKHSNITVTTEEKEFEQIMSESIKNLRNRLKLALQHPYLFHGPSLRILFLLPSSRTGGGSTSVIKEALEMKRIGITVRIALWDKSFASFISVYPDARELFIPWPKKIKSDNDRELMLKLRNYGMLFDIVIATVWVSTRELLEMAHIAPTFLPAYYVQDYEPDFFPTYSLQLKPNVERVHASQSYKSVASIGGVLYAKSAWLANKVFDRHGCKVHIVPAAIEHLECQEPGTRIEYNSSVVRIVAMLRPSTLRRNAKYVYNILKEAKREFGNEIDIITFGCDMNTRDASFINHNDFDFTHWGVLNRSAMSNLYSHTDVFLDLSIWQAYGRSAAEAMTCGNTAIVTNAGGANEFIRHGYNGFLVDISKKKDVMDFIREVVQSRERLTLMQQRARGVREELRLEPAVIARLNLLTEKLKERKTLSLPYIT